MCLILSCGTTSSQYSVDGVLSTNDSAAEAGVAASRDRCAYPILSHRSALASVPDMAEKLHPALHHPRRQYNFHGVVGERGGVYHGEV